MLCLHCSCLLLIEVLLSELAYTTFCTRLQWSSFPKNERVLHSDLCVVSVHGKCWKVVELAIAAPLLELQTANEYCPVLVCLGLTEILGKRWFSCENPDVASYLINCISGERQRQLLSDLLALVKILYLSFLVPSFAAACFWKKKFVLEPRLSSTF